MKPGPETQKIREDLAKRQIRECFKDGRVIRITGAITRNDGVNWKQQIENFSSISKKPILMYVSSRGGEELAIPLLETAVKQAREEGIRVYTLGDKECRSAAFEMLLLGHPSGIYVTPGTKLQMHGTFPEREEFMAYESQELKEAFRETQLRRATRLLRQRLQETATNDTLNIEEAGSKNQLFSADEAIKSGIIDGIMSPIIY